MEASNPAPADPGLGDGLRHGIDREQPPSLPVAHRDGPGAQAGQQAPGEILGDVALGRGAQHQGRDLGRRHAIGQARLPVARQEGDEDQDLGQDHEGHGEQEEPARQARRRRESGRKAGASTLNAVPADASQCKGRAAEAARFVPVRSFRGANRRENGKRGRLKSYP